VRSIPARVQDVKKTTTTSHLSLCFLLISNKCLTTIIHE
jgi:hypothetical protein